MWALKTKTASKRTSIRGLKKIRQDESTNDSGQKLGLQPPFCGYPHAF
jgi:hypothetical protein